ncbi:MarR family transcriptional regulator [Paenibacillus sp. Marseille-P2973]|uniref:Transcriptional regulator n=2 Tax=Paenibacillus TaxID=44249 RepID=A0ABQ4M6C0_9BACL|nr:MarR family transcriptional regulator [Paenibacillus sp. Marseille-P2973]GIP51467.1 transcriptional regulator [Paenibacillus vini]
MNMGEDPMAQRLMEVLSRFRKAEWHKTPKEGFTPSELKVLLLIQKGSLKENRGVAISTISSMMGVSPPTVTPLVRSLETQGLITRFNDQEDRRVVRVKLTEKGEEIRREVKAAYARYFTELNSFLGPERSSQLADLLELVFQYLDEKHKQDINHS